VRRNKPLRPKIPERADSKNVVESILRAATVLLQERGLESFTTNHIAERAGVGIASVYRYFADKQAVIAAIDARNRRENAEQLVTILAVLERDFAAGVRAMLQFFLDTSGPRGRLRRAVVSEVPLSWVAPNATKTMESLIASATAALTRLHPALPVPEIHRRLHVVFHALQGLVVGQLVFPLADLDRDTAVAMMEPVVLGVLLAPAPEPRAPGSGARRDGPKLS
jgi:AcrR family transcriptional regulator